jgi:hypothetical protein
MPNLPTSLDEALNPDWLTRALAVESGGRRVTDAELVARIQDNPRKPLIARFKARYEDGGSAAFCLKVPESVTSAGAKHASVREAQFFLQVAPKIAVRTPPVVFAAIDEAQSVGLLLMRDMVEEGARFCSALEPFDVDRCSRILEQLARLHCAQQVLGPIEQLTWTSRQIEYLSTLMAVEPLQKLLDDPRSDDLPAGVCDAARLVDAVGALARVDAAQPTCLIHGDCHAGNIFETPEGLGLMDWQLLQQGGWAIDLAYHIGSVLPVAVAEREERALLNHYLDVGRGLGATLPDHETAWLQYRQSFVYGLFLWSITMVVEAPIIKVFMDRLGSGAHRHDTYRLLGV